MAVINLAGSELTFHKDNGETVMAKISNGNDSFYNYRGTSRVVLKELSHKNITYEKKQEVIVLLNEFISAARYSGAEKSHKWHDWLDNYGKNDWDNWYTYFVDKNNSIGKAVFKIANTENGEKILYDIDIIATKEATLAIKSASALPLEGNSSPSVDNYTTLPIPSQYKYEDIEYLETAEQFLTHPTKELRDKLELMVKEAKDNAMPLVNSKTRFLYKQDRNLISYKNGIIVPLSERFAIPNATSNNAIDYTQYDKLANEHMANPSIWKKQLLERMVAQAKADALIKNANKADIINSKSTDPITFDDDGNIIPLTDRFNPRKRDPRFSTSIDDRELSIDFGSGDLTVSKSSSADVLDSEPVDPRAMSIDEAMKTYELYRNERKVYDRARSINRLTEDEMIIVGRLLRGESVLESFVHNPRYNNIKAVYEASQKYNELGKKLEKYRKGIKANYFKEADSYLDGNMDKFKDKKYGLLYDSEIADRNIRDVVQDKSLAKAILDTYFTPVQQANAKKIKDLTAYRNRVKALNLSRDVAKGNVLSESAAVQMVGELEDKLVSLDAKTNRGTKENRAIAQEEYFKVEKQLNDLWESNPKLDKDKIERACVEFRKIYDELIDRMNRTRVANGYEPVPYRQGYFPHFLDEEPDTLLGKMAYKLGIRLNQDALPTTINGITDQFRPGIRWFGNALERKGNNTTFDAVQGFDRYIEGALDMIHHTENIQRVRALATRIRYNASDEGIKRQMERILGDTSLSDEEQHTRIQELYATAPTKLSNFVVWLDEYANLLANKKSSYDRLFERAVGRSVAYNFMKWANSRVAANMIGGNLSSAFTNFIPLAQANSVIGPRWVIQAAYQTLRNTGDKDGFIDTSDFLVNRYGSDRLVDDTGKFAQALGVPMELIDGFASQTIVRAAYLKNKASGMSDEMAMADADRLAYLMMANRSKGEMPNIMSAKNPIVKAFTAFQLEVNNEYRFLLKDLPERKKEEGKSAIVALMMYFLNAYIFNDIYETIVGRRSALDPLDWVNQFAGDVTGYRLPNFLNELVTDGLSADDFKVGRKGFTDTVSDMLNTVGEDLPFSSAIGLIDSNFSGGRIPLSSAIPNFGDISKAIEGGNASKIGYELYDELSKPLSYFALPTGGNQLQKTGKAALEYMMGEGFNYDSYGNKIIRYPVEQNVPNAIKGAMFGRSAFPTFQDWLDNGSLSTAQSEIYNELDGAVSDSNVDIYNALKNLNTRANTDTKLSSIYDSGLSSEAQEMIYRDIMSDSQVNALDDALAGGMDSAITLIVR